MARKITKAVYEDYLNSKEIDPDSKVWIIGGKHRTHHANNKTYGTALRYFDPIEFETGYKMFARAYGNLLT